MEHGTQRHKPGSRGPWCFFRCGESPYAVDLGFVAEVVEVDHLVRLPLSPPRVIGLCTLRRELIPVVRLVEPGRAEMACDSPSRNFVLILRTSQGAWGVRVSGEGTAVAEADIESGRPAAKDPGPSILGTVRRGEIVHAVIDPEATWREVRESVEAWYGDRSGRVMPERVTDALSPFDPLIAV